MFHASKLTEEVGGVQSRCTLIAEALLRCFAPSFGLGAAAVNLCGPCTLAFELHAAPSSLRLSLESLPRARNYRPFVWLYGLLTLYDVERDRDYGFFETSRLSGEESNMKDVGDMTSSASNRQDGQPSPRAEMLAQVQALRGTARTARLAIRYGKPGHIDDEVVVMLALTARRASDVSAANEFASALLRRIGFQVKAHVGKNIGWQRLGGGKEAAVDDFTQAIALLILEDPNRPCHAEVAFGNYVYKKALDQGARLYAKKHSAAQTLDDDTEAQAQAQAQAQESTFDIAPDASPSPEEFLQFLQKEQQDEDRLRRIREIVESDDMPEKPRVAFTYRYWGPMQIDSKKTDVVTIVKLMGVTEKTVTKYIDEAIAFIRARLEP